MRKLICLVIAINFFLIFMPGKSYAADPNVELNVDYLTSYNDASDIDTVSLHILEKISEKKNKSIYRGITITRPHGDITLDNQTRNSSAVGVGPIYMLRHEKPQSDKISMALDISGGLIIYDKVFPAGGRYYNFMWRIGPQFIYKINDNSTINAGYMLVHVSNGFKTHNPGYDSRGVTLGFTTKF